MRITAIVLSSWGQLDVFRVMKFAGCTKFTFASLHIELLKGYSQQGSNTYLKNMHLLLPPAKRNNIPHKGAQMASLVRRNSQHSPEHPAIKVNKQNIRQHVRKKLVKKKKRPQLSTGWETKNQQDNSTYRRHHFVLWMVKFASKTIFASLSLQEVLRHIQGAIE